MFILATPVDFSLPVNSRDSEWIGALFGASSICRGLSWWGDNIYSFWSSGKGGAKVCVKRSNPMDPGLFIRIDPAFIHKGVDYYGNPIGQVWFVIELFGNDPTNNSDPDVQVNYDAVFSRSAVAQNGNVALPADKKWKSYVMKMPACYFNQRYEPFVGRSRDIAITPLSLIGSWIGVRKAVIFKYEPKVVLTLNCDKSYARQGDIVELEASVIDSWNQPLEGKEVCFEVVSGSGKVLVGNACTDSSGVAKSKLYVSGSLPIIVKATVDPGVVREESILKGQWSFDSNEEGWTLGGHFSYDSTKGHDGAGAIKFENSASSVYGPNTTDPDGENGSEFLSNPDFSGSASGWNYNSGEFDYNGTEGHDAAGCMEYKSGDGVNFHQIIDFNAEGIDSSDAPLWVCARAWVKQLSSASGSAYIDLYNSAYDANNSPAVPADDQWHLVAIYDVFNWSTIDPDGTWGNGDELQVRGIRDNGASGTVYFDDFEIEIGWNNPNPSFEYPEYSGGKGGWEWDSVNCVHDENNLHFFRQEGSYSGVSPKDGNAFAVVEVNAGATHGSLNDRLPLIEPDAWYKVSGWIYRSVDFNGRVYIDVYCGAYTRDPELGFSDLFATSPGWTYVEGLWHVPSDWDNSTMTALLRCVVDQNPTAGFACFDNVKIEKIESVSDSNSYIDVSVESYKTYRISGWIYRDPNFTGNSYIDIYNSSAADPELGFQDLYVTKAGEWTYVEGVWTNTYGVSSIQVRLVVDGNPFGAVWFDDIKVEEVEFQTEGITTDTVTIVPTDMVFVGPSSRFYRSLDEKGINVFVEGSSGGGVASVLFSDDFPDLSKWSYDSSIYHLDSTNDHTGNGSGSVKITPTKPAQAMHTNSNFTVKADTFYRLSCWAKGEVSAGSWYLDFGDYAGEPQLIIGGAVDWTYYFTYWYSSSNGTLPAIRIVQDGGPQGTVYVDDVKLEELNVSLESWGMTFWHAVGKKAILTRADASNPNSDYLKADVNNSFAEGVNTFYAVVEYQGSVIPDLQYHTSSGTATASVVGIFPSTCDFNYAVYKLVDADLTVSMDVTPDVVVYDKGVQIKIAGLWVSYSWPIPDAPQLEDTVQGVRIKFPESGRWAIYRKNGSTWELLTTYSGTEYIDTSVSRGQTYRYRIARVWGHDIYSPLSSEAEVKATKIMEAYEAGIERSVIRLGDSAVIYVNLGSEMQNLEVCAYSLSGVKVFEKSYRAKGLFKAQLSTGGWTPGIYLVVLRYGEKKEILRLIIRR